MARKSTDQSGSKDLKPLFAIDPDEVQVIQASGLFDAAWYADRYKDVDITGMDPCRHFLRYGRLLKRAPGPDFDSAFYLETYVDVGSGNPLLHFLQAEDRDRRFTTRQALEAHMQQMHLTTAEQWLGIGDTRPGMEARAAPIISYCIPVMGRLADLKGTLAENLQNNEAHRGKVEFLIVTFGEDTMVQDWAEACFPDALADGYLRIVADTVSLDSWHFGKAKNAFRAHLHGQIYSSLDADNFVTQDETQLLLDLRAVYPAGFLLHHFSGQWGDGTSGRISMPAPVYRHVGYDAQLLPRQFDEIDVILGSLTEFPALPFLGIDKDRHIFTLSGSAHTYAKNEKLPNRRHFIGAGTSRVAPLNPRGKNYTATHPYWRDMGNLNAALSAYHRTRSKTLRADYEQRVATYKHRLIERIPGGEILGALFRNETLPPFSPILDTSICVVACVHDEDHFLPKFVDHHRRLGATHFLFIDDNSARPVRDLDLGENVLALRPKVGDFRTCKTLWMEGAIKALVPEGNWVCTLDADEMLQLPDPFRTLGDLTQHLAEHDQDFATCLLLDMLPDLTAPADKLKLGAQAIYEFLGWFCDRPTQIDDAYASHRSIAWGFGPHAEISFRHDARYHAFGTFDSLRKTSVLRYRPSRHLNQGFHTFHYIDGTPSPGTDIWQSTPIVPIFHYKLLRMFSEEMRGQMLEKSGGYHARTAQNISSIFGETPDAGIARLTGLAPYLRPAAEVRQRDFFIR